MSLQPATNTNPLVRTFPTREKWLAYRTQSKRIGASECAAALGESPWCSALELWGRKTGKVQEQVETARMRIGQLAEDAALQVFNLLHESVNVYAESLDRFLHERGHSRLLGERVVSAIYESAEYPWMAATPDAFTRETDALGLLEIKCPGADKIHAWRDEPPLEYVLQLYHQFIVCREAHPDLSKLRLVAWFGGSDLIEHDVPLPDDETVDWIVQGEKRLVERILAGTPPPPDGSKSSTDALRSIYGAPKPATQVEIPDTLARRYFEARVERERWEKVENEAAADVMAALADNEEATLNGCKVFQWKDVTYRYQAKAAYEQTRRVFQPARNWKKHAAGMGIETTGPNED